MNSYLSEFKLNSYLFFYSLYRLGLSVTLSVANTDAYAAADAQLYAQFTIVVPIIFREYLRNCCKRIGHFRECRKLFQMLSFTAY